MLRLRIKHLKYNVSQNKSLNKTFPESTGKKIGEKLAKYFIELNVDFDIILIYRFCNWFGVKADMNFGKL